MRRTQGYGVLGLLAVLTLPSCSFLGLGQFPVLECDTGVDCDPINDRDGIADEACERWVCNPERHACFFGTRDDDGDDESPPSCGGMDCDDANPLRGTLLEDGSARQEVCDGIDNDCDFAIDELADEHESTFIQAHDVVATIPNGRSARYGASGSTHAALTLARDSATGMLERAALLPLDGSTASTPSELEHETPERTPRSPSDPVEEWVPAFTETVLAPGCPQDDLGTSAPCNERDVALSGDGGRWVVASVTTRGCDGAGELRIAPLGGSSGTNLVHQGPDERSHLWYGVGTTASAGCTTNPDGSQGARAPALSALPSSEVLPYRELLAAYLADPAATCEDDDEVEVEALGLWLTESSGISWVEATGDGAPTPMGTTRSVGGPSIVAWPSVGWLMGFGDAAGGVALRFAASPLPTPPPPPREGITAPSTDPLPRVDLPTIGTADVERVALALGHVAGRTAELGIAFQEGCEARVHFARVLVDLDAMTATPIGASMDLGVGKDPAIAYVDAGMRVDPDRPGGFVVLYAAPDGGERELVVARIADATGALVGTPFDVGPGTSSPHLYAGAGISELRFAYLAGDTLMGGSLFCAPPIE